MENYNQQPKCTYFTPVQPSIENDGNAVVIVTQPQNIRKDQDQKIGSQSKRVRCPSCQGYVMTNLMTKPTKGTHLVALGLCICCLWPCACLPYCINYCQNVQHYCPNCGCYIGSYYFLN